MVLVEVTKGDSDLRIQLGIWGVVALKGFSLLGLEIMYFFSCCTTSYVHAYTDYTVNPVDGPPSNETNERSDKQSIQRLS